MFRKSKKAVLLEENAQLKNANLKLKEGYSAYVNGLIIPLHSVLNDYMVVLEDAARAICPLCAEDVRMEIVKVGFLADTRSDEFHEGHELCKANKLRLRFAKIAKETKELNTTLSSIKRVYDD